MSARLLNTVIMDCQESSFRLNMLKQIKKGKHVINHASLFLLELFD